MAFDPAEPRDKQGKWSVWYHGTTTEKARQIQREGLRSNLTSDEHPYSTLASHADEAGMWAGAHGAVVEVHIPDDQRAEFIDAPPGNLGFMGPARLSGIRKNIPPSMIHKVIYIDPRQAELSNDGHCLNCGCARPDSIADQIELGWHFNPLQLRGPDGRWVRGLHPAEPVVSDMPGWSAIKKERISDGIVREWRKARDAGSAEETDALNLAGAAWDAEDHKEAVSQLRRAATAATAHGNADVSNRYRILAARIETADDEAGSLEAPVRELATTAVPEVDRMVGGHSVWNGKVDPWPDDDPEHAGVAAEMRWDGTMGIQSGLAQEIQRTQHDPDLPIADPVAYQDVLHELIHSELQPGDRYNTHSRSYQDAPTRALEEGFTELGAHHHAHEFFDAIGVGGRDTPYLAHDYNGDPIPSTVFRQAVSRFAADLHRQQARIAADPRAAQQQAARHLASLVDELGGDPEAMLMGDHLPVLSEIQHLGDPDLSKWATDQKKQAESVLAIPAMKHDSMNDRADKYDDPDLIANGSGWGHYAAQTRAAQAWVEDVARAEGQADLRPGTPGNARAKALADEVNREGPADKDYAMAVQVLRAMGQPDADSETRQVVAGFIRNHWLEKISETDGLGNYQAAAQFVKMIQAPSPHKMAELAEAM